MARSGEVLDLSVDNIHFIGSYFFLLCIFQTTRLISVSQLLFTSSEPLHKSLSIPKIHLLLAVYKACSFRVLDVCPSVTFAEKHALTTDSKRFPSLLSICTPSSFIASFFHQAVMFMRAGAVSTLLTLFI